MSVRPHIIVLFLVALILTGCQQPETSIPDEKMFRDLVSLYDTRLAEAFAKGNMADMKGLVTPGHGARLDHRLAGMKKAGLKMESHILAVEYLGFENLDAKKSGFPRYRVRTREVWDVRHLDSVSGKPVKEIRGLIYQLKYEFEQHDGIWQVDAVEVLQETK